MTQVRGRWKVVVGAALLLPVAVLLVLVVGRSEPNPAEHPAARTFVAWIAANARGDHAAALELVHPTRVSSYQDLNPDQAQPFFGSLRQVHAEGVEELEGGRTAVVTGTMLLNGEVLTFTARLMRSGEDWRFDGYTYCCRPSE